MDKKEIPCYVFVLHIPLSCIAVAIVFFMRTNGGKTDWGCHNSLINKMYLMG